MRLTLSNTKSLCRYRYKGQSKREGRGTVGGSSPLKQRKRRLDPSGDT